MSTPELPRPAVQAFAKDSTPSIEHLVERLTSYLAQEQTDLVRRAYYYAEQAHDGQRRRSGEPYVTHPLAVAYVLASMRMDHQTLMAAMLHDVIEDTGIAKEALAAQFGEPVAELVDGVSKLAQIPFESKAIAQAENFQKMAMAMARDIRVIIVKLADRLHNMRTLGGLPPEKQRRIARETLEIYSPIANRLGMHDMRVEFEDLCFRAIYPMRAALIQKALLKVRGRRNEVVHNIKESLVACLQREGFPAEVTGREKHLYSIYKKMRGKRRSFKEIMDVYAFRIVVDNVDNCYRVLGAMHNLYKPVPGRFKDYIAIPKSNGYQSLHTSLVGMHGIPIEIQIRTIDMDEMASRGIAAHWLYKSHNDEQPHLRARRWINEVLELQKRAGDSLEFIESVKIDLFPDEVYVFTPRGRIMELPRGATAVDFAYAVHTNVGNACIGCRINRRLAPLSQALESGCTVEIICAPSARPNPSWLHFAVTGKARANIRHALKLQRRSESVELGRTLLTKALDDFQTQLQDIDQQRINNILSEYKLQALDDLLEEIGLGARIAHIVANQLLAFRQDSPSAARTPLSISGTEGLMVSYAKCCTPIPGDPIIGHLSAGKGIVVHLANCKNITELRNSSPQKCAPLTWAANALGEFDVELRIELESRRGVVALLATSVNEANANIEKISVDERDGRTSVINTLVSVHDRVHLASVIRKLRKLGGVIRITRVRN